MDNEKLKNLVLSFVPDAQIEMTKQFLSITVTPEKLHFVAEKLKNTEETYFDYLFCLSGVDWIKHLSVVYHLTSTKHKHTVVLKVIINNKENPTVDTVCDLWKTADFHEREVFDLFGIRFNNHPDLRRILMDESWKGYPLRKDYVDEVNIVER
jgi:NADH/F420H2 dehydrogenase subunit C